MALEYIDIDLDNDVCANASAKEFVDKAFKAPFSEFDACPDLSGCFRYCPAKYTFDNTNYMKGFAVRVGWANNQLGSLSQVAIVCYTNERAFMPEESKISTENATPNNNTSQYYTRKFAFNNSSYSDASYFNPKYFRAYKIDDNGYFLFAYRTIYSREANLGHPIAIYGINDDGSFYFGSSAFGDSTNVSDVTYKAMKSMTYLSLDRENSDVIKFYINNNFTTTFYGKTETNHWGVKFSIPLLEASENTNDPELKVKNFVKIFDNVLLMQSVAPDIYAGMTYIINGESWLCLQGNNLTDNNYFSSGLYPSNAALLIKE